MSENLYNLKQKSENIVPIGIITSKWTSPIEAFTPNECHTEVLDIFETENLDSIIKYNNYSIRPDEVVLIHETTPDSAKNILNNGFRTHPQNSSQIRNNAVFGWPHYADVGHYQRTENDNATYSVLFKVSKRQTFVSSYESSAKQLLYGEISEEEYENKHILNFEYYEELQLDNSMLVEHLGYSPLFPTTDKKNEHQLLNEIIK